MLRPLNPIQMGIRGKKISRNIIAKIHKSILVILHLDRIAKAIVFRCSDAERLSLLFLQTQTAEVYLSLGSIGFRLSTDNNPEGK